MIGTGAHKAVYHTSSTLNSVHKTLGEWNMNEYHSIDQRGTYISTDVTGGSSYASDDADIYDGGNEEYVDQGAFYRIEEDGEWISSPDSMFMPRRPDPGIIKLNAVMAGATVGKVTGNLLNSLNYQDPRYYASHNSPEGFDYWNSIKRYKADDSLNYAGLTNIDGTIAASKPFAVYRTTFETNKIVIKTQNHIGYPTSFHVDVLQGSTWNTVYTATDSDVMASGVLTLYYGAGHSWTLTNDSPITDLSMTNTETIRGIRFWVSKMQHDVTSDQANYVARIPLEVIEISPRLELDLTSYVIGSNVTSSMSDTKSGMPVGNLVQGSGNLKMFVPSGEFFANGSLEHLVKRHAKFSLYQVFDGVDIPIGEMYAASWTNNEQYEVDVQLNDASVFFTQQQCPDFMIADSRNGVKLSLVVMMLLDSIGFTGYEFRTDGGADPVIRTFFAWREKTVMEVLEEIAKATQSAMFIDAFGNLVVMTKEYMTKYEDMSNVHDWMIGEPSTIDNAEHTHIDGYLPNIQNINDTTVEPVTDAEVSYTHFDIQKVPDQGYLNALTAEQRNDVYTSPNAADFLELYSKYTLIPEDLWGASDFKQEKVLGYGMLLKEIPEARPSSLNVFLNPDPEWTGANRREAIRDLFSRTAPVNRKYIQLSVDVDGMYTLDNQWQGYLSIDSEIIAYDGKVYIIGGAGGTDEQRVFFSREEYTHYVNNDLVVDGKERYIIPIGVLIRLDMERTDYTNGTGTYKVVGDGRGALDTDIENHVGFNYGLNTTPGNWGGDRFATCLGLQVSSDSTIVPRFPSADLTYNPRSTDSSIVSSIKRRQPYGYLLMKGPTKGWRKTWAEAWTGSSSAMKLETEYQHQRQIGGMFFFNWVNKNRKHMFRTRMTILNNLDTDEVRTSIGGIAFGVSVPNQNEANRGKRASGYFVEFDAEVDTETKNVRLYWLKPIVDSNGSSVGTEVKLLRRSNIPIAAVPDYGDPSDGNEFATKFDVSVQAAPWSKGRLNIKVWVNGVKILEYLDSRNRMGVATGAGLFVRGDSQAAFDYFQTEQWSSGNRTRRVYRRDFSRAIREVKEFDIRYEQAMAYRSAITAADKSDKRFSIIDNPRLTKRITKYSPKLGPYGAKFYVKNTGSAAYTMDEAGVQIGLSGIVLKNLGSGTRTLDNYIDSMSYANKKLSKNWQNKKLFAENSVTIGGDYVQSPDQADELLNWIAEYANRQRDSFEVTTFANPLWEVGDKIKLFYPSRGYTNDEYDKTFVVTGRSYNLEPSGPSTTFNLLEVGA